MRESIYYTLSLLHPLFKQIYKDRLRVLAYHKVPDRKAFEAQIIYLKSHYQVIGIEDLLAYFEEEKSLPKNALLITFDDGDVSVLKNGLPLLRKHRLKSCLFIITGLIDTSEDVWIKRVEAGEMKRGKSYSQARQVVNELKNLPNRERERRTQEYPPASSAQLTTNELKEISKQGMFIGSHTHSHPMLDKCTPKEIREELISSKGFFDLSGLPGFKVFAYPNGNENPKTTEILKSFEMKLVFLFDHQVNKNKVDPLRISRIRVDSDTELTEFKAKVSGAHPFVYNLKRMYSN